MMTDPRHFSALPAQRVGRWAREIDIDRVMSTNRVAGR